MSGLQPPKLVRQNRISVAGLPPVANDAAAAGAGTDKKRAREPEKNKEEEVLQEATGGDPADQGFWDYLRDQHGDELDRRKRRIRFYRKNYGRNTSKYDLPHYKHLTDMERAYEAKYGQAEDTFAKGPGRHYPEFQDQIDERKRHLASFGVTAASLMRTGPEQLAGGRWHRGEYNRATKRLNFEGR